MDLLILGSLLLTGGLLALAGVFYGGDDKDDDRPDPATDQGTDGDDVLSAAGQFFGDVSGFHFDIPQRSLSLIILKVMPAKKDSAASSTKISMLLTPHCAFMAATCILAHQNIK